MRRWPLLLWLVAVWIALWGDLTVANVASGTIAALAVAAVTPAPPRRGEPPLRVRPFALLRFQLHFLRKLVVSTAIVAWKIVTPRNRVQEAIVAVQLRGRSSFITTVVANAVSLTPGTITLDVDRDGGTLYVHILHLRGAGATRRDVLTLEELASSAFGGRLDRAPSDAADVERLGRAPLVKRP